MNDARPSNWIRALRALLSAIPIIAGLGAHAVVAQEAADLGLAIADAPDPVAVGGQLTYTITVTNDGPSDATGVLVIDDLPPDVTFVSAVPECAIDGPLFCDIGNLVTGATATLTIVVTPTSANDQLRNMARVQGSPTDPNTSNDSDVELTQVVLSTPPTASNVLILGPPQVGQVLTGSYEYADAEGDLQGASTFRWLHTNGEVDTPIDGATALTYALVASDEGAFIRFEVTPVAQSGPSPGLAVSSDAVGPVTPPSAPTAKFVIGDRVQVSAATHNVRNAPAGTLIGSQPRGALGTVVAGPVVAGPNNITWWQINYDTGTDGWSGEGNLTKFVGREPPPPPPDKFVIGDRVEVSAAAINVRDAPAGTLIGSQPQVALGTVVAGPVVAGPNNITWWQINYDTGTDGWSGEGNLTKFGEPTLSTTADLAVSLSGTPAFLTVNGQLTYTITVENNGPGTATGVQVVDILPPEALQLGPADSSQGECRGTVRVDCDLRMLAAGAEATVTINVIPTVTGDLSNAAHVTALQSDPNAADNSSTETTTVQPSDPAEADLAITAAVGPRANGFTYTLTVTNRGLATATGVQLTNDLPGGVVLEQIIRSQGSCGATDPVLCDLGALPTGAAATVMIHVIRTEVGTLPNRAAVNGEQHDPDTTNNFALTSAVELPTSQTTCNSTRCRLTLTCNLSGLLRRSCENQVTLFVDARARRDTRAHRLSHERAARPPRLVRFAAVIKSFPGGQTQNVPLKLTSKGKKLARKLVMQGKKKLRGQMRITNAAGGIGNDIIPLTVRLK